MKRIFLATNYIFLISIFFTFISCTKEVSVSEPTEYEVGLAKYYISTNPEGAAIFIDGKPTGLFTPDTVKWLEIGDHDFKLKLFPFLDISFSGFAAIETTNSTEYNFYSDPRNFGSISCFSDPDSCEIYLNDSLLSNKTPQTINRLLPGTYKIKFSFPSHRSDSTTVFVRGGANSKVNLSLSDTTIWVDYNTNNSKIPSNTVTDILIDDEIGTWIGTSNNGVAKKNGDEYQYLNKENSNLPSNIISCLRTDEQKILWVGTYAGIAKINNGLINTLTTVNSGIPSNHITDIAFDKNGDVWIGTREGLAKYDGSNWQVFNTSNSNIPGDFISKILFDNEDSLWVGTIGFNTAKYHGFDNWTVYQSDNHVIGDAISDLIIGTDNNLWIGTMIQTSGPNIIDKPGGVFSLNNGILSEVNLDLPNKRINKFFIDNEKNFWICTREGVVELKSIGTNKYYSSSNSGLPINDIISINKDRDNNIWFGTNGGGLVKYKIWKN